MPIYQYKCRDCGKVEGYTLKVGEKPDECIFCKSPEITRTYAGQRLSFRMAGNDSGEVRVRDLTSSERSTLEKVVSEGSYGYESFVDGKSVVGSILGDGYLVCVRKSNTPNPAAKHLFN